MLVRSFNLFFFFHLAHPQEYEDFRVAYPRWPELHQLEPPSEQDRDQWIDLSSYINKQPHTLYEGSSYARIFRLFRTMGLRHLIITDYRNRLKGIVTRKDLYGIENSHTPDDFRKHKHY